MSTTMASLQVQPYHKQNLSASPPSPSQQPHMYFKPPISHKLKSSMSGSRTRKISRTKTDIDIAEVFIIGDQVRDRMHAEPELIKDRRYHLRTYQCCFIGSDCIDWLVRTGEASDRENAVYLMRVLQDFSILHHVCDDHKYQDTYLFYRFRKDDGSFPQNKDTAIFMRAQKLYQRLFNPTESCTVGSEERPSVKVVQNREEAGLWCEASFLGNELVDWLVERGECDSRDDATRLGRELLANNIISHVTNSHNFKDAYLVYQFLVDFTSHRHLSDLLKPSVGGRGRSPGTGMRGSPGTSSPSSLLHTSRLHHQAPSNVARRVHAGSLSNSTTFKDSPSPPPPTSHHTSSSPPIIDDRFLHGVTGVPSDSEDFTCPYSTCREGPDCDGTRHGKRGGSNNNNNNDNAASQSSLPPAVPEHLDAPHEGFVRHKYQVLSDECGYGLVIRGTAPPRVHLVDPAGPAARVGLFSHLYVTHVNSVNVSRWTHQQVAASILASPHGAVELICLEDKR